MPATVNMGVNSWLLNLLHTAVTFVLSLGSYWTSLASKLQFSNSTKGLDWLPAGYYTHPVADEMHSFAGMKTPLHLGILVLEDTYCLTAIALVIGLGYSIGTRHFSVYVKGFSSADYLFLQTKIAEVLSGKGYGQVGVNVQHIMEGTGVAASANDKSTANVRIVHPGDGQKMLVDVTKQIAHLIKQGHVSQEHITPDFIDKLLQSRVQSPDPDMVLRFGTVPSTCGYLPWQMRLSEIISMSSLRTFSPQRFKRALMSFSKIEQRFGR